MTEQGDREEAAARVLFTWECDRKMLVWKGPGTAPAVDWDRLDAQFRTDRKDSHDSSCD